MILIDALYINDGGGKVLLDYLISELEKSDKNIFYLLDKRVRGKVPSIKSRNQHLYLKASLVARHQFYKENKHRFTSILCFGNLPPNIRLPAEVYTYFHQLLYLQLPQNMPFAKKILYRLKIAVLNFFKKNTDFWLVQSKIIKAQFLTKYKILEHDVMVMPFYPSFPANVILDKKPNTYLYISNATSHKNHERLIEAFSIFYRQHQKGELILTVSENYPQILKLIEEKQKEEIPIKNIGFVPRNELQKLYMESEYIVFPSLAESFGLGLIEAIENGCNVIGADLPYTYAVCEPSLTFNPYEIESMVNAFSLSLRQTKASVSKVKNEISTLLKVLN